MLNGQSQTGSGMCELGEKNLNNMLITIKWCSGTAVSGSLPVGSFLIIFFFSWIQSQLFQNYAPST